VRYSDGVTRLSRERADVATLAVVVLVVPLTWWLLLGWSWPRSLAGHDAIAQELLIIREVAEGGGWSSLVFRPDLLGGFKGQRVLGPFPLYALLGGLGLSTVAIAVASALAGQALLAFLASRAAADVAAGWSDDPKASGWVERLGVVWLCAFAPVLAWRVSYGHLNPRGRGPPRRAGRRQRGGVPRAPAPVPGRAGAPRRGPSTRRDGARGEARARLAPHARAAGPDHSRVRHEHGLRGRPVEPGWLRRPHAPLRRPAARAAR